MFLNLSKKVWGSHTLTETRLNNPGIVHRAVVVRQGRLVIPKVEREPLGVSVYDVDHRLLFVMSNADSNLFREDRHTGQKEPVHI
jgi:bifunctional DNA-binding transcriptional regulator/antitoxin component of YhaV-PrlF toxin-antitoxin module